MSKLLDMEADPRFANLSYADQVDLRSQLFNQTMVGTPEFDALDDASKQKAYAISVYRPPVMQNPNNAYAADAQNAVNAMQSGDYSKAAQLDGMREGMRSSLLIMLAKKSIGAIQNVFDPTNKNDEYNSLYGSDAQKANDWMEAQAGLYGGKKAIDQINTAKLGYSLGIGAADFMATMLLGGEIAKGAQLAIGAAKGLDALTIADNAAKAANMVSGVMTGTHAEEATNAALKLANPDSPLLKAIVTAANKPLLNTAVQVGAGGAEAGLTGLGVDVVKNALTGNVGDMSSKDYWDGLAHDWGMSVVLNYFGWGIAKAAGAGLGALGKAVKGFAPSGDAASSEQAIKDAFQTTKDNVAVQQLDPTQAAEAVAFDANARLAARQPKTEAGQDFWAQVNHFQIDRQNKTLYDQATGRTTSFVNDVDLAAKLGEMFQTGTASESKLVPDDGASMATSQLGEVLRKTTYKLGGDVEPSQLRPLLDDTGNDIVDRNNKQFFAKQYAQANGVPVEKASTLDVIYGNDKTQTGPNQIRFDPEAKNGLTDFMSSLDSFIADNKADGATPKPMSIPDSGLGARAGSVEALQSVGQSLGYDVRREGGAITVTDANGTQRFDSVGKANSAILGKAYDDGKLSLGQLNAAVSQRTGYSIEKGTRNVLQEDSTASRVYATPEGRKLTEDYYNLYKITPEGKKIIDSAGSISELFDAHPEMDLKIPSTLAPQMWIADGDKLVVQDRVAIGPPDKLLELGGNFSSIYGEKVEFTNSKGKIVKGDNSYVVHDPNTGFTKEFGSVGKARAWLEKNHSTYEKASDALALKGHILMFGQDGSPIIVGPTGESRIFGSMKDVAAFTKDLPNMDFVNDALGTDPATIKLSTEQAARAAEIAKATEKSEPIKKPGFITEAYARFAFPTLSYLQKRAREHGDYSLVDSFKKLNSGIRLTFAADAKTGAVVHSIFNGVKREQKYIYQVLISHNENEWASLAKKAFDYDLTEADVSTMHKLESLYSNAFEASGMSNWKRILSYAPRIADYARSNLDEVPDSFSAADYLKKAFHGNMPHDIEFFSENQRSSSIVRMALEGNAEDAAVQYLSALNRYKYMGSVQRQVDIQVKQLEDAFKNHATRVTKTEIGNFKEAIDEFYGLLEARSARAQAFKEQSRVFGESLQRICQAMPILKNSRFATEGMAGDLIDAFNSHVTLATQAKPWAIVRNMMQVQLLGAALDNNKVVYDAFKDVVNDEGNSIINRMINSGASKGTLYTDGARSDSDLGVWRRLMKWNENMDLITRATAFRSAERLIDASWPRFEKGIIDASQFIKETGLSILDNPEQKAVMDALNLKNRDKAVDLFGQSLNNMCFFDYSKFNRAPLQRGMMGKVFGKFMTYPAGTMAFYHRIATSGSAGERIARSVRMVATSAAIYEAFKMAGIDYKGFTAADPFTFQGGPLWTTLADGSSIVGKGASATTARTTVSNLARSLSPTWNFATQVKKAMDYLEDGDVYSAALALSGAPVRKDLAWKQR